MRKNIISMIVMLPILVVLVATSSCKDDTADRQAHVNIYLTDAPAEYDAVYIDIQAVEITSDMGVETFDVVTPGVYNLLEFNSGIDTLIISEDVSPRTISQIRLILGSNNTVVVDGESHPLETPSAQTSGLKLNVHYTFEAGLVYDLWLDFDAEQSIVEKGNGDYSLKPVIRVYTEALSGAITGVVFPTDAAYYVQAMSATDTAGTYISADGSFLIGGLPEGSYSVNFSAVAGFTDITLPGVSVTTGIITDLGEVTIPL
ncbi:MAG TPA: DUF4382 domain-containing protein [Chitinophagales bacterium]|nr:DUF4382 domain-containing protein [Chitinophagales bacterium]HMZ88820.1 DUF4382 domain-containing protein [Chitinophagales bacterium]HNE45990.1 DUF4382 domain-containing protein [Chitinophagales bacterium]HNF68196.1 DUF4382 domain-containing protein [Chitinophagales bacterium]HNI52888.1 DUF4382 domain-containing protein [Chitinophagales bacterium]